MWTQNGQQILCCPNKTFIGNAKEMDNKTYNDLLKRYDNDEEARVKLCKYWLSNIKRRLISKYGKLIDVDEVSHDILLYFMEHRAQNKVFAPLKFTNKCIDNYIASHIDIFYKTVTLDNEVCYEQDFKNLDETDLMQTLKAQLKSEDVALIIYRHYVDDVKEKDIATEKDINYTNVRAIICRARKKLKEFYSKRNKN